MTHRQLAPAAVCAALALLWQAAGAEEPQAARPKLEVAGYLQVDYRRADAAPAHEFNVHRARLAFSGTAGERVSYTLVVQGDGLDADSLGLIDASVGVRLAPWARLQAGQFKYDFDLQGRESATLLAFSDRPHATQTVAGSLDGSSTPSAASSAYRDRGLSLAAETSGGRWRASLGLYQGHGRASDNNSSFAPVVRVQAAPAKGLLFSGGLICADTADARAAGAGRYRAWTLGSSYARGRLLLRAEYYGARRTSASAQARVEGFYVQAVRSLGRDFEALARFQSLADPAVLAKGSLRSIDLGARYYLARLEDRGGTNLLVNLMLRRAGPGPLEGLTLLSDGRGAVLTRSEGLEPVFVARLQVQF